MRTKLTQALENISAFIRTLLDDADAATARATLGLGTSALLNDTYAYPSGDVTSSSSAYADITGCSVAVVANATYAVELYALAENSSTSGVPVISINGPTFDRLGGQFQGVNGAGNISAQNLIAYDTSAAATTVNAANQEYLLTSRWMVRTNASGNIVGRFARLGTTGTATCWAQGTMMRVSRIQ